MENISYKKQVQRLIEQIGELQSIDTEKHKYFSEKAKVALEGVTNGDFTTLLDLEAQLIDFLQERVRTNQTQNLPSVVSKPSLMSKINKLFSRAPESEISKIAEQIYVVDEQTPKGQFVPDKRTMVYDFFEKNISTRDMTRDLQDDEKLMQFTNDEGHERTFEFYRYDGGLDSIKIDGTKIETYSKYIGVDFPFKDKCALTEYLHLIKYSQFISANPEEHQAFVDFLGRKFEDASKGYEPNDSWAARAAGKKLHKALARDPEYKRIKTSFDRAYSEYQKTVTEFRQNEANRRDSFDKQNSFFNQIKVEGASVDTQGVTARNAMAVEHEIDEGQEPGDN